MSRIFIQGDLSQAELRIAASVAFEDEMLEIYRNDGDIHVKTGLAVAPGYLLDEYNKEQDGDKKKKLLKPIRQMAKSVNFGLLYSGSPQVLKYIAKINYGVDMTDDVAISAHHKFFELYPRLTDWHESVRDFIRNYGITISPIGRVRRVPEVFYLQEGENEYEHLFRSALNSTIQSGCSDFLGQVWCRSLKNIRKLKLPAKVVLTVHDSVVLDSEESAKDEIMDIFTEATKYYTEYHSRTWLKCPMRLDFSIGKDWGGLEELD